MKFDVFLLYTNDCDWTIKNTISKICEVPRYARIDGQEYTKQCYYNFVSKRIHDKKTMKPINNKVYSMNYYKIED